MISAVILLICVSSLGAQSVEDRVTSGLTQLINPGAQGPYPGAQAPYPAAQAPYPAPAAPQHYEHYYEQPHGHSQGFTVQTGYEGIIAPQAPEGPFHHLAPLHKLGGLALGAGLIHHFLPFPLNKLVLFLGTKLGVWALGILLLVVIGGAATTAVCALTPICTISFLHPFGFKFSRESVRSLLTQDRLNSITQFVHDAIDRYQKLQNREGKAIKAENKGKKPILPAKIESKAAEEAEHAEVSRESKELKGEKAIEGSEEVQQSDEKRDAKNVKAEEVLKDTRDVNSNELPKEAIL